MLYTDVRSVKHGGWHTIRNRGKIDAARTDKLPGEPEHMTLRRPELNCATAPKGTKARARVQ
eukprot:6375358-Alexandrium_andersonii.AAC.1